MTDLAYERIDRARARAERRLDLAGIGLRTVPEEVGELTQLESLELDRNRLTELPPALSGLVNLRRLTAAHNHLTSVPDWISNLKNLEVLNFGPTNAVTHVSTELYRLSRLHTLVLGGHLSELPAGIGACTRLETLYLGGNELSSLPPDIAELRELKDLRVAHNALKEFPRQILDLPVTNLYITDNAIGELPAEIGRMSALESLDISNNELRTLPAELADLPALSQLTCYGNPLDEPLGELVEQGKRAVFSYLSALRHDGISLYETKVLLVGEGDVGKTSLVEALQGHPFVERRPTTHGIELATLDVAHPQGGTPISLNLWDFGGQEVYRITHQFFFSRRALYLLVWKPRQGQEENAIEFWLKLIRLRVGSDVRVMIVATHGDERRPELDLPHLRNRFGPLVVGHWVVDSKSGRGVVELRHAIAEQSAQLPQMGERMSRRWVAVRDALSASDQPQISSRAYRELCTRHGLDGTAATTLAELLSDLGYIVYFGGDDGLRDVMVLQPEWLTKAIGYVLEDETTRRAKGELDHGRLGEIWGSHADGGLGDGYPREHYPYFLRLMEKFDVSCRVPDTDRSLIAQLVPYERAEVKWATEGDWNELTVVCRLGDEPIGLMAWLTARSFRFTTGIHWRRGVQLAYPEYSSEALVEFTQPQDLRLEVRAPAPTYLFSILRDTIEDLIRRRWPGLEYDFLVPCKAQGSGLACPGVFKLSTLERMLAKRRPTVLCSECIEDQDVALLLTGVSLTGTSIGGLLEERAAQLDRLEAKLESVQSTVGSIEALSADTAFDVRAVRNALGREVIDCPRLFAISRAETGRWDARRVWRNRLTVHLWCEHPGYEHPCEHEGYEFAPTREWLQRAAPYLGTLAKVLRLLPVASAAVGLIGVAADGAKGEEVKRLKAEIDLMNAIASAVPPLTGTATTSGTGFTVAEGDGFRAFRELLFDLDGARVFAGLRRVLTAAGDYLWICPEHYREYDPGLPELPPTG